MARLFPLIQPQTEAPPPLPLPLCKEVAWDFKAGKPLFRQGDPVVVTGVEAVKVWCWKALMTQRTRYPIYTWDFGSDHETLMGQNYTGELKAAEAARYVREALEINPYITAVRDIRVSFDQGDLSISCHIITIYGEVNVLA